MAGDSSSLTPDKKISGFFYPFPHIHIVEASAGSGKTYCLAQRYLQLIINSNFKAIEEAPLNNILAITFTNKASLEMKERILEFLKQIALDSFRNPSEKERLLEGLSLDKEGASKKAYLAMDCLIQNYNFFQVQTIDSFINAILSGCAFKLDLSAGFKIRTDYQNYLSYSLDKLIDRSAGDKEIRQLLHSFLRQYLYIENRPGWFAKNDILDIINSLFTKTNKYGAGFLSSAINPEELIVKKRRLLKLMNELSNKLPADTHASFSNSLASFLENNREGFDLDSLSDFFARPEFPIKKDGVISNKIQLLWRDITHSIRELCEMEAVCIFNPYINIFNLVLDDFKAISAKEDVLFLEAMNKEAGLLFTQKAIGVPELYYRLATRLRHFLIDEFQDTSALQWKNLYPMIEEALSTGGSLFYVGDRKQAIYRFRGGEVSLMNLVKDDLSQYKIIESSLSKNYRSHKEIVEFNNHIFSSDNLRRFLAQREELSKSALCFNPYDKDEIINVFQGCRQAHRQDKSGGYVKVELIDNENRSNRKLQIKERLFTYIRELKERFDYQDIALLARENDEVELLSEWLLGQEIPVESEKTLSIEENSYIKELVSFLKFLNSPIDNLSFASFILGDIFSKAAKIKKEVLQDFLFSIRDKKEEQKSYLYRHFRREFPQVWEKFIEEFFKNVGFVPLYELVISIIDKFKILENFPEYQGFLMHFLELIKKQEDEEPGISGFLEYFQAVPAEELYVNISGANSIKILTIHKAKGLEFPVVIIPFLEMNVKQDTEIVSSEDNNLKLLRLKKSYTTFSPRLKEVYCQEYKKAFIDELNNIYVALTRAIEELYILVPKKNYRGVNPLILLLPEVDCEKGEKAKLYRERPIKGQAINIPVSKYQDWIGFLKEEFIDLGLLQKREKVQKGDILHYILSFIGNLHKQDKERIITRAIRMAKANFNFLTDLKPYEEIVRRLLEDIKFQEFFTCPDYEIYQEKDIVDCFGNTKRIDRLLLGKNKAVIIDYKSSREKDAGYKKQVKEYIAIIKDIYPRFKVEGYLIYLDELNLEKVNE